MVLTSVDETLVIADLIEAYIIWDDRLVCLTPKLTTMAKVAKMKQTVKGLRLEVVNPSSAGIDISPQEMQEYVPSDRDYY